MCFVKIRICTDEIARTLLALTFAVIMQKNLFRSYFVGVFISCVIGLKNSVRDYFIERNCQIKNL